MDEQKREDVRIKAKEILDNFSKALDKVKVKGKVLKEDFGGFRKEEQGSECDEDFRKRMFANAHSKNEDCIIAETKKW
ncbi:MAG: hypothetical protein Q8L29_02810 [archaeon]|nr:hypothetical protein [archaeon]